AVSKYRRRRQRQYLGQEPAAGDDLSYDSSSGAAPLAASNRLSGVAQKNFSVRGNDQRELQPGAGKRRDAGDGELSSGESGHQVSIGGSDRLLKLRTSESKVRARRRLVLGQPTRSCRSRDLDRYETLQPLNRSNQTRRCRAFANRRRRSMFLL